MNIGRGSAKVFWAKDKALKSFYSFNTDNGLFDELGGLYNLTNNNASRCSGFFNNPAFYFNGSSSYLRYANQLISSLPFSWLVWIKPFINYPHPTQGATILSQGATPGSGAGITPWLEICGDNLGAPYTSKLRFGVYGNTISQIECVSNEIIRFSAGKIFLLVATVDSNRNPKIYVNGQDKTQVIVLNYSQNPRFDPNFYIGANAVYNSYYFNGIIDEVAIFTRALSPQEIKSYYQWATGQKKLFFFPLETLNTGIIRRRLLVK